MVTIRQRLIAEDVKVEKTFYSACHKDIKEHGCNKKDKVAEGDFRRANILLCLENVIKTGKIQMGRIPMQVSVVTGLGGMVDIQYLWASIFIYIRRLQFLFTFVGFNFVFICGLQFRLHMWASIFIYICGLKF